ncbi:oligosaccharide flippase family protein [Schaalia sp. JY-X169]|uniref:oligosaccharide flippase family protein n=1 Tax=Schaalia sp. JY-X169 TaxID=2758572 RepID=UPI0015F38875|nr:oligosaccharide flippase family protein [Schaalia sp. JY-X169]
MKIALGGAAKGFLKLISGSIGARLISLIALPILSRLYSPDDYGYVTFVTALATIAVPVVTLRLESAAMLPREEEEVSSLARSALVSSIVLAPLYGLALWALSYLKVGDLWRYEYAYAWVVLLTLASAWFAVVSQLALRQKLYGEVAKRSLYQSGASAGVQLAFGFVRPTAFGLMTGQLAGSLVGIGAIFKRVRHYFRRPNRGVTKRTLWKYRQFPTWFTFSVFMNEVGLKAPVLLVGMVYGASATGQLGMAERLLGIPLALIATSVSSLVSAEFSEMVRTDIPRFAPTYLKMSAWLALPAVAITVFFVSVGPWFTSTFLGSSWAGTASLVQIMAIVYSLRLVASPLSGVLLVLQRARLTVMLDVLRVVLVGSAVGIVLYSGVDLSVAVTLLYGALSVVYVVTWFVGWRISRQHDERIIGTESAS